MCDLFGSWAFPPGELPNGSVRAEVMQRQLRDEVIGFALSPEILAKPDGFNKEELVSLL